MEHVRKCSWHDFSTISKISTIRDKLHKVAGIVSQSSNDLYLRLVSDWQDPTSIVIGEKETPLLSTGDLTA